MNLVSRVLTNVCRIVSRCCWDVHQAGQTNRTRVAQIPNQLQRASLVRCFSKGCFIFAVVDHPYIIAQLAKQIQLVFYEFDVENAENGEDSADDGLLEGLRIMKHCILNGPGEHGLPTTIDGHGGDDS